MAERMQSMFSRAVEDQLSEQRQLAEVLTQVRVQLDQLAQQLQEVRQLGARIDGVAELVQERGRDLAEQRAALTELTGAVTRLQQRAEGVDAGLRELRQAFTGVAARSAQLPVREDLEAVSEQLAAALGDVADRL